MMEATGTWSTVLYTVACMDLTAAFLAIVVLRPTLAKHVAHSKGLMDKEKAALGGASRGGMTGLAQASCTNRAGFFGSPLFFDLPNRAASRRHAHWKLCRSGG